MNTLLARPRADGFHFDDKRSRLPRFGLGASLCLSLLQRTANHASPASSRVEKRRFCSWRSWRSALEHYRQYSRGLLRVCVHVGHGVCRLALYLLGEAPRWHRVREWQALRVCVDLTL